VAKRGVDLGSAMVACKWIKERDRKVTEEGHLNRKRKRNLINFLAEGGSVLFS